MRILVSAYVCGPGRGSENGVGWNWVWHLSKKHEVHVLTTSRAREQIELELQRRYTKNLKFHYVGERYARTISWPWRLGWFPYYLWQWQIYRYARKLHAEVRFELSQHVTYASWRVPSFLSWLGIPFIWGPIGGGQRAPLNFLRVYGFRGALWEVFRTVLQYVSLLDPFVRSTMKHAAKILVANTATTRFLPSSYSQKFVQMLETGIDMTPQTPRPNVDPHKAPTVCRLLWIGTLEPRKALPLMIEALSMIKLQCDFHLSVVGDGAERARCERLTAKLGLKERIGFIGRVPYSQVQSFYRAADIFIFTILRETSGNVLLEAMAAELPVICLNLSGPADITRDDCAIRIAPRNPKQVVRELGESIIMLIHDPALRRALGEAGRKRVMQEFTWTRKMEDIERIYSEVLRPVS